VDDYVEILSGIDVPATICFLGREGKKDSGVVGISAGEIDSGPHPRSRRHDVSKPYRSEEEVIERIRLRNPDPVSRRANAVRFRAERYERSSSEAETGSYERTLHH